MTRLRVFVSGASLSDPEYELLSKAGCEVVFGRPMPDVLRDPYSEAELASIVADCNVLVYSISDVVSRPVLKAGRSLWLVTAPFIGFDQVDVTAATELGIAVANSPSAENARGMAEATIGLVLALVKRLPHNEAKLRAGEWGGREDRGDLLFGKTVGLLGFGRIGREIGVRLAPWGVRMIAHDPYVEPQDAAGAGVELVNLETLCRESDVLSLHAVLNERTRNVIDRARLALMKPGAYLINAARGELLDERALADALEAGRLAGAALDTFWIEPLPANSPLREVSLEKLILTPHIIGHTEVGRRANLRVCLNNVLAVAETSLPPHTVNREVASRWRGVGSRA